MNDEERQLELVKGLMKQSYFQGMADGILVVEKALTNTANKNILDGEKAVGFSYAIILVGDTYDIVGVERPEDWEPEGL